MGTGLTAFQIGLTRTTQTMFFSLTLAYIWAAGLYFTSIFLIGAMVWYYLNKVADGTIPRWLSSLSAVPLVLVLFGLFIGFCSSPFIVTTVAENWYYGPKLHAGMTRQEIYDALDVDYRNKPEPAGLNAREYIRLNSTVCVVEYNTAGKLKTYKIFFD